MLLLKAKMATENARVRVEREDPPTEATREENGPMDALILVITMVSANQRVAPVEVDPRRIRREENHEPRRGPEKVTEMAPEAGMLVPMTLEMTGSSKVNALVVVWRVAMVTRRLGYDGTEAITRHERDESEIQNEVRLELPPIRARLVTAAKCA
jgi:hypothetical protein